MVRTHAPSHPHTLIPSLTHTLTDDSSIKLRTLERTTKTLKSEKSALSVEMSSMKEQLSTREREMKNLKSVLEETKDENSRLTEKYVTCVRVCLV